MIEAADIIGIIASPSITGITVTHNAFLKPKSLGQSIMRVILCFSLVIRDCNQDIVNLPPTKCACIARIILWRNAQTIQCLSISLAETLAVDRKIFLFLVKNV